MLTVQSKRNVGCRGGYSYKAFGVYEAAPRRDGKLTYRLVKSGRWFRSDVNNQYAFAGIPIVEHVRHGSPVPNGLREVEVSG